MSFSGPVKIARYCIGMVTLWGLIFRLSKKEKQDLEYKKTVLKLAKEHRDAKEIEKVNRYYIPKDDEKPQDRYVEEEGPKGKLWDKLLVFLK